MAQFSTSPGGRGDHRQTSVFNRSGGNKASNAESECESGVGETGSAPSGAPGPGGGGGTLCVDVNAPLASSQRIEKTQQMIKDHSAFRTTQQLQEYISMTQKSLLRMPGVASSEAKEVNEKLKEMARLVSHEYVGLLEQHIKLTLDYQEAERCAERCAARLSRDAIESKRQLEDKTARFDQLAESYGGERETRERYEADIRGIGEYLTGLATQMRAVRHKVLSGCEASTHSELVLDLDGVISGLDDKARATPCSSWADRSSSNGSGYGGGRAGGSGGVSTPRPSTALVRTAEQETQQNGAPMSPANKDVVTSRLKALGVFGGDAADPSSSGHNHNYTNNNGVSRSLIDHPRTPINGRSMAPAMINRTPTRNNFSPLGRGASPGHGRNYSRSRGSAWNMSNNNHSNNGFGGGGPRSRTASISASNMPFQPPPGGGMPRRGTGGFFNYGQGGRFNNNPNSNNLPNIEFPQTSVFSPPVRPGTAFEGHNGNNHPHRDSRHPNTMAVGFGRNRSGSSGGVVPQDPFQGPSGVFPGRDGYALAPSLGLGITAATTATLSSASTSPAAAQLTHDSVQLWQRQIRHFYQSLHAWVERHASPDRPLEDIVVGSPLWPVLLRTYRPLSAAEAGSYLEFHLRENLSRYCLITRVVVDYVVNLVWVPGGWKGADTESTLALSDLESEMKQSEGLPSYQYQPLLDRQADIIESILHRPSSSADFLTRRVRSAAASLLGNLSPLLAAAPHGSSNNNSNGGSGSETTLAELSDVLKQAYDISSALLTSRVSFDYRFPLIGSRFTSQCMVNVWPGDMEPLELQARHWRVALVTTPVITCRSDNGTDISAHAVSHADVFCMQ